MVFLSALGFSVCFSDDFLKKAFGLTSRPSSGCLFLDGFFLGLLVVKSLQDPQLCARG